MIKTVLLESKAGVHKCEVASGLEKYLPCPWPGCKNGINTDRFYKAVEDDHVYLSRYSDQLTLPEKPLFNREIYIRRQTKDLKWQWYFEREE